MERSTASAGDTTGERLLKRRFLWFKRSGGDGLVDSSTAVSCKVSTRSPCLVPAFRNATSDIEEVPAFARFSAVERPIDSYAEASERMLCAGFLLRALRFPPGSGYLRLPIILRRPPGFFGVRFDDADNPSVGIPPP